MVAPCECTIRQAAFCNYLWRYLVIKIAFKAGRLKVGFLRSIMTEYPMLSKE